MTDSAQDRANATAKCPGSFHAGRKGRGDHLFCRACSFSWEQPSLSPDQVPVAPWHRAVR